MSHNAQIINAGAISVAEGATVDFVPEADVPAGSIVVVGKLVGIAKFGISAGSRGTSRFVACSMCRERSNHQHTRRHDPFWSQISWHVVKNAYSHPMMGKAIEAAPPGTLTVRLRLSQ